MPIADLISTNQLAALVGVVPRTMREYISRGIVKRVNDLHFNTVEAVQAYCAHLRETAAQRTSGAASGTDDPNDLVQQRALLANAQRKKIEREEAIALGKLVDAEVVSKMWYEETRVIRDAFLNLPDRVAPQLVGVDDVQEVSAILLREVTSICQGLSDG